MIFFVLIRWIGCIGILMIKDRGVNFVKKNVFELNLIKYIKHRDRVQIQIQAFLKNQIQIQIYTEDLNTNTQIQIRI